MYTFFDVGANSGTDSLKVANSRSDAIVYAFEPTPRLIEHLKSCSIGLNNYIVVPKAVSNYNGETTFYISGNADWGCSSICEFNNNLEETWPGRKDFKVTDQVKVDVIKLVDFIKDNNIESIDYLHVDAQGQDLEVLIGLEDKINIVKAGVIEMPTSHNTKLYKNQKYLKDDAINFLKETEFKIKIIHSKDPQGNKVNLFLIEFKLYIYSLSLP